MCSNLNLEMNKKEGDIMATRDYTSIYSVKDFAMNEIAPKYFDLDNINQLNIGLLGYVTELIANTTEDSFNATSTFIKEIFPNKAIIPETIYNYAALFQIDNLFATAANMNMVLFVAESDIIKYGEYKDSSFYQFVLDSNLVVNVEGKQFMLDYDILIDCKPYKDDYIYTASYNLDHKNTISDITNPYIKVKRVRYSNVNYLGLFVNVKQVVKTIQPENIINNDKINLPTISFEFSDKLANFEVYYKAPDASSYTQLSKLLINSTPLKNPFCFYKFNTDNEIQLTFTSRDNYFQPVFNSELMIHIYTTSGAEGNFPLYTGNAISVIPKSDTYDYNNNLTLFAIVQSESIDGGDSLTLDELRSMIVEKFSTVSSYTNENDLQIYFSSFKYKFGNDVLFIKRRDDAFERLFSAFAIMKDQNKDIYPTNTLYLELDLPDFDLEYEQSNMYLLKAGHTFRYKPGTSDTAKVIPNITLKDDLSVLDDEFVYTNPFLMTISKSPSVVGFYMNSINQRIPLEYSYVNSDSIIQFICNSVSVTRNALKGDNTYKLTVLITPTSDLDQEIIEEATGKDLGNLVLKGMIEDGENSVESCFIDFKLTNANVKTNIYTFEAEITTDDYMTLDEKFRVFDVRDIQNGNNVESKLIPMLDCTINIYAFYKYKDASVNLSHKFDYITELEPYTLTNMYSTQDQKIDFITPMTVMRSRMTYNDLGSGNYNITLSLIPFVKALTMQNDDSYAYFIDTLYKQYNYMEDALDKITNNYGVDMKFYNTYGKAKNFIVGEDGAILDRVNCGIRFKLNPTIGADEATLIRDVKIYIKDYVEGINDKGYNAIYVSNMIQSLKNDFNNINYLKFACINNYDSSVQVIENKSTDLSTLTKDERRNYVPEFLTMSEDDILIDIIYN